MPPNRIVALFTPVVAVAAGGAAAWLADNVGLDISSGQLQAVFIAGLAAVLAPAAQWLHGFQKFEVHQQDLDREALAADAEAAALASAVDDDDEYDVEYDDDYDDGDDEDGVDDEYEAARDEAGQPEPVGG